ncbi:MAG: vitamin B12 dependent-methionine synthase activation domain-containing protein [Planctomycetota bacterium]
MTPHAEPAQIIEPFAFRIQPHLYGEIAGWYAENADLFIQVDKAFRMLNGAQESLQQKLRENAILKPCSAVLAEFMALTSRENAYDNRDERVRALGVLSDYGRFFREVKAQIGCAGKPLNERVRKDLHLFMKEYNALIQPAVVLRRFSCCFEKDRIRIDDIDDPIFSGNLYRFFTARLNKKPDEEYATYEKAASEFAPPEECYLFAATIGPGVDREVVRLSDAGETYKALMLNGMGAGAADMVAYDLEHFLNHTFPAKGVRWRRFHVGYGDFDLKEQRRLFTLLDPARIGIHLTPTCLMIPEKSVSGIVAVKRFAKA